MFHLRVEGYWNHVTLRKQLCNPVLRRIQFWTNRPYVIASLCDFNEHRKPVFRRYTIQRVQYEKR